MRDNIPRPTVPLAFELQPGIGYLKVTSFGETTADELEEHFGFEVRSLVLEVTDDKRLEKPERKRLQVEHAPHMTPKAKCIKIADKIANLTDLLNAPPARWPEERIRQYFAWSREVVDGCRGHNHFLESRYDEVARSL